MTGTYDWNPMPHKLDIQCPACGSCATFEFVEIVRIELKKDIEFFQQSSVFDYQRLQDSCGHYWHGALYFAGLHGGNVAAISELPDGYSPEDWSHNKYLYRGHGQDWGSVVCSKCHLSKKHNLKWPHEAFFSVDYKGHKLWAFHRESAVDLKNYIKAQNRELDNFKWQGFLLHIPVIFKQKKARDFIVKHLDRLLRSS